MEEVGLSQNPNLSISGKRDGFINRRVDYVTECAKGAIIGAFWVFVVQTVLVVIFSVVLVFQSTFISPIAVASITVLWSAFWLLIMTGLVAILTSCWRC